MPEMWGWAPESDPWPAIQPSTSTVDRLGWLDSLSEELTNLAGQEGYGWARQLRDDLGRLTARLGGRGQQADAYDDAASGSETRVDLPAIKITPPGQQAPLDQTNYSYLAGQLVASPSGQPAPLEAWNYTPLGGEIQATSLYTQPVPIPRAQEGPGGGIVDWPAPSADWSRTLRGLRLPSRPEAEDWLLERSGDFDQWARRRIGDVQQALEPHAIDLLNRVWPVPDDPDAPMGPLQSAATDAFERLFPGRVTTPGLRQQDDWRYWARDRGFPAGARRVPVPDLWGEPPPRPWSF